MEKTKRHPLSLGFQTELIFHRHDSIIEEREDYMVIKTPNNPNFIYGNLLLFYQAPKPGSLQRWKQLYKKEFQDLPAIKYFCFLWNSPDPGELTDFAFEGFKLDTSIVLTANPNSLHAPQHPNPKIKIRPLTTEEDWTQATQNQILSRSPDFTEASYTPFKHQQMKRYQAMAQKGQGHWFGAFIEEKLVGDLGIYTGKNLGRYQSVETHPDFLKQGICQTLVYETAKYAFEKMGVTQLVMVADQNYHSTRIYESVGFKPTAKEYSAFWRNRDISASSI